MAVRSMSASATPRITGLAARRIALLSQGFGRRRAGAGDPSPTPARIAALVRSLGLLQLDSVNVFLRAHYMPVYSRLGAYDRAALDRLAGHTHGRLNRRLFEYWAHEASLLPMESQPLMRWRMADLGGAWGSMQRVIEQSPELVTSVLALVTDAGPVRAGDTGFQRTSPQAGQMWNWHLGKVALEHLFYTGQITAARRISFERWYDLAERVIPADVIGVATPSREDAQRELMRISARALGVGTEPDLGDWFRLPRADSKARVAELVACEELEPVVVRGWEAPAYLWHEAPRPRPVRGRALLSPFDPLIWFRPRVQRLFGFRYRIEIYVPAPQRVFGYYVLPFLLDEALVARVDLKSDRQAGVLRVQSAFAESHAAHDVDRVAFELAAELHDCAAWLGLQGGLEVIDRGDLAPALTAAAAG
jgi:uncharacterized protein YcaQ